MLRALLPVSLALGLLACDRTVSSCGCVKPDPDKFQADFPSAKSLNARLGKGINLGNALDAPSEGAWGVTLKADYFKWIADSGFASVRIPVRFSGHALAESPYTLDSVFLDRVAWAVDQALQAKLNVVLDMHHYDSLMAHPAEERPRFLSLWKQICARFREYPAELVFELLNEPRDKLDAAAWNDLLAEAIDSIRVLQPRRTLVVGTSPWGGLNGLGALKLPSDSNLIVTVHYYEPHVFTHQGAAFEEGAEQWVGTPWRATAAQRAALDQDLESIRQWSAERNRPIFLGEFGTYYRVDSVSRAFYAEYLTRGLDSAGFSWAAWNFSSDFGLVNDTTGVWKGYLVDALLHHGRNAKFDSVLAAVKPIDVSTYVVMDDFEDSLPRLPASARKWRESQGLPLTRGGANWYVFSNDSSDIRSGDGTRILPYQEVDAGAAPNFQLLSGPWGIQGQGLHAKVHLLGGTYPFAGFGAGILGGWDSTFTDMTKVSAIQFKAKGRGQWMLEVVSDSIQADTVENWGHMTYTFRPGADWGNYLIPAEALAPKAYSRQAKQNLAWEDVRKKIIAINFTSGQGYGPKVDTTLELWVDDIRLIGVTDGDLGM